MTNDELKELTRILQPYIKGKESALLKLLDQEGNLLFEIVLMEYATND